MDKIEIGVAYAMVEKTIVNEILATLTNRGMRPPFVVVGVSRNGAAYIFRSNGVGMAPENLVVSSPEAFVKFPVDCLVVDATGEVQRASIEPRPPA